MNAAALSACIDRHEIDGAISLAALASDVASLEKLIRCFEPELSEILLRSAKRHVSPDRDRIEISGTAALQGVAYAPVSLAFEGAEGGTRAVLEIEAPLPQSMALLGLRQFSVERLSFAMDATDRLPVAGASRFVLRVGDKALPMSLEIPPGPSGLRIEGAFEAFEIPSLSDLASLVGWDDVFDLLPQSIRDQARLKLRSLSLDLDALDNSVQAIGFAVQLPDLEFLPGAASLAAPTLSARIHSPFSGHRSYSMELQATLKLGSLSIDAGARLQPNFALYGCINKMDVAELLELIAGAGIPGLPRFAIADARFDLSQAGEFGLRGSARLDFGEAFAALGIPIPSYLSAFAFEACSLASQLLEKRFEIGFECRTPFPLLDGDDGKLNVTRAKLDLSASGARGLDVRARIEIDGSARVADGVSIELERAAIAYDSATGKWRGEGAAQLRLPGQTRALEIVASADELRFVFQGSLTLFDLKGGGAASVSNLSIFWERLPEGKRRWGASGSAAVDIEGLFQASGRLAIESGPEGSKLAASLGAPTLPRFALPLEFEPNPTLDIAIGELAIAYERAPHDPSASRWQLRAAASVEIEGIPDLLKQYLPAERLRGRFEAGSDGVSIDFDVPSTLQPSLPELALTFGGSKRISFGQPQIRVTRLALEYRKARGLRICQTLRVSAPDEANRVFGSDAQGRPTKRHVQDFDLQLRLGGSLSLTTLTSPFAALEFREMEGDDGLWTDWNLGALGRYSFRVPEFEYGKGRWKASGGFRRYGDVKIPLTPLKALLKGARFPGFLVDRLPKALAFESLDLASEGLFDRLLGLADLAEGADSSGGILRKAIEALQSGIAFLPEKLRNYLKIEIPESATLDISVDSVGGGAKIGLRVLENDKPIKLLFPSLSPLPELVGAEIREFSFGQRAGGGMITVGIDGHIDRFDLPQLALSLAVGAARGKPIDFSNRFLFEKATLLFPSGAPLPIPLFYDRIGIDYQDVIGFRIQSQWMLPDPDWGVAEFIEIFQTLYEFASQPSKLLRDDAAFLAALNLAFTIGPNHIRLPSYLGGATLGLAHALPPLDAGFSIASLLDAVKTGNLGYALQAIPLRVGDNWIRVNAIDVAFGPLRFKAGWCATTEREFREIVLPEARAAGKLPPAIDESILSLAKRSKPALDRGFVILLGGEASLAGIAGIRARFGMALTRAEGFQVACEVAFSIANRLRFSIGGVIQADLQRCAIKGAVALRWKERNLVTASGDILISDTGLEADIKLELTDHFWIGGRLAIGASGCRMKAAVHWGAGASTAESVAGELALSSEGVSIGFAWSLAGLDGSVAVALPGEGDSLLSAHVSLQPSPALQAAFGDRIKAVAQEAAAGTAERVYDDLQRMAEELDNMEISLRGMRTWLPRLCDEINKRIDAEIDAQTASIWKRAGRPIAKRAARPHKNRIARVRDAARRSDDAKMRAALKEALLDLVNNNRVDAIVYARDLMNASQLAQLRQAIGYIDRIPSASQARIQKQAIYDQLPEREKLLAAVNREVAQGVADAIPYVESIGFATSLGKIDPTRLEIDVRIRHKGRVVERSLAANLLDPVGTAKRLAEAFG